MSLPSRGAWIEIRQGAQRYDINQSLPSRGAWIEMALFAADSADLAGRSPRGERG